MIIAKPEGVDWGGDFAQYISQAKFLCEGTPQTAVAIGKARYAASTHELMIGPAIYPWGYPLLIAPAVEFFGIDPGAIRVFSLLSLLSVCASAFLLFRSRLPSAALAILILTIAFSRGGFDFAEEIGSDPPFAAATLLALFLMRRSSQLQFRNIPASTLASVACGVAIGAATEIRAAGLALLLTLPVAQAVEINLAAGWRLTLSRFAEAVRENIVQLAAPYLSFAVVILVFSAALPGGWEALLYKDHFVYDGIWGFLKAVAINIRYYATLPSAYFDIPNAGGFIAALVLAPLAAVGAFARRREDALFLVFAAIYMTMLLALPYQQGVRMIYPVLPIALYFAAWGAIFIDAAIFPSRRVLTALLAISAAMSVAAGSASALSAGQEIEGPYAASSVEAFNYVEKHTEPGAAIIFFKPRVLTLYAARLGLLQFDRAETLAGPATHILVYHGADEAEINQKIDALAKSSPENFALIWSNADFALYRVVRGGS